MSPISLKPAPHLLYQYEALAHRIRKTLNGQAGGPVMLAVTSYRPGEGASCVAANFAAALSSVAQHNVLLVDGNLHYPSLQRLVESPSSKSKVLAKKENGEMTRPTWRLFHTDEKLDILLVRQIAADPARLLRLHDVGEFLERSKEQYQYVVIDCPPLATDASALNIVTRADGVVLVVESGAVRRQALQRSIQNLEEMGARVLGVILNKRKYPIPSFIYKWI